MEIGKVDIINSGSVDVRLPSVHYRLASMFCKRSLLLAQ
jgi:hypothetical protein